jgi:hypothetical protein
VAGSTTFGLEAEDRVCCSRVDTHDWPDTVVDLPAEAVAVVVVVVGSLAFEAVEALEAVDVEAVEVVASDLVLETVAPAPDEWTVPPDASDERAVVSDATSAPRPTALATAVRPMAAVARRTRTLARSRDRASGR